MQAQFSAEEIIEICSGRLAQGMMPDLDGPICTDTRSLAEGDWYLALSGEKFDGHDFLGDAFARGAVGAIVSERPSYPIAATTFPLIAVSDAIAAYHALARNWRRRIRPLVIAITGSSGKTTTKEMCASVMSAGLRTHKSRANENNEFGVPKTILSMPDDTQALVVEMAMRGPGQIDLLAQTAEADIAIVVNAGVAHLELLGSQENIVKAKCEVFERLDAARGVALIGQPSEALLARAREVFSGNIMAFDPADLTELEATMEKTDFSVKVPAQLGAPLRPGLAGSRGATSSDATVFSVHAHGQAHLQDAWCAITAGRVAGLDDQLIAEGLNRYSPVAGRGNRLATESGAVIIDETYNANPDSVRASVEVFLDRRANPKARKFVVLGDLAELGPDAPNLHRELGQWLAGKSIQGLVTVGGLARYVAEGAQSAQFEVIACRDQKEAESVVKAWLSADSCVLIKGSHSANLDRLVSLLVSSSLAGGH